MFFKKINIYFLVIGITSIILALVLAFIFGRDLWKRQANTQEIDFEKLYSDYSELDEKACAIEAKYLDEEGYIVLEKKEACLSELMELAEREKRQGLLSSYKKGEDSILFKFSSGISYYFSFDEKGMMSGNGLHEVITIEASNYDWSLALADTVYGEPADKSANRITEELPGLYTFPNVNNVDSFEVDDIKSLEGKKVIIWDGHGGFDEEYGPLLAVSNEITDQYVMLVYGQEIANEEILLSKDSHCVVTPKYFENHLAPNSLKGSLVFLGACHSMHNTVLSDVLRGKGADVVLGYTNKTYTTYMYDTMSDFFERLTYFYPDYSNLWTVEDAKNDTYINRGNYCVYEGSKSYFKVEGNEQFRLVDLEQEEKSGKKDLLYTAEDLIDKSVPEIVEIMGGDFEIEFNGSHLIHYTSGGLCIYNDQTLPGFTFFIDEAESDFINISSGDFDSNLAFIKSNILDGKYEKFTFMSVYDGAAYNEEINANMDYEKISAITGYQNCIMTAGIERIIQDIDSTDMIESASIYYDTDYNDFIEYQPGDTILSTKMKCINPKIDCIVVFPKDNNEDSLTTNAIELSSYQDTIELGSTYKLYITSKYSVKDLKIEQANYLFKIYVWDDHIDLGAYAEGKTVVRVTDPDGNTAYCDLTVETSDVANEIEKFVSSIPYMFHDEAYINGDAVKMGMQLFIDSVSENYVTFHIENTTTGTYTDSFEAEVIESKGNSTNTCTLTDNLGDTYFCELKFSGNSIIIDLRKSNDSKTTNDISCSGKMIVFT